jgi:hypothetical protein
MCYCYYPALGNREQKGEGLMKIGMRKQEREQDGLRKERQRERTKEGKLSSNENVIIFKEIHAKGFDVSCSKHSFWQRDVDFRDRTHRAYFHIVQSSCLTKLALILNLNNTMKGLRLSRQ